MLKIRTLVTAAAAAALVATLATAAPAQAGTTSHHPAGTRSLAAVLTAHGGGTFDHNPYDYDIVTQAVLAVLKAKPSSPVAVLTQGSTPLTAFLPDDQAFRILVKQLTGKNLASEQAVFNAVAGLGIPAVETVLLYHVVPGATITKRMALQSNGATLTTAEGASITVRVRGCFWFHSVSLVDQAPNVRNPRVIRFDINKGNVQIAHGIDRVLLPSSSL